MYQALYRKYRPAVFDDVYGQRHITDVLRQEVKMQSVSHAYLFSGSRGTGKTTCAKILAKAVNCEHPVEGNPCGQCDSCKSIESGRAMDVIEMDAASNNGVDYIREIKEDVVYSPASVRYRVYILDEVHMLTEQAFNALLKTLEEPPEGVIFILATTEIHKIPATVLSRCLRFEFRRISAEQLAKRLLYIADQESISIDTEAVYLISSLAGGGMRDAISMLELCAAAKEHVTVQTVRDVMGVTGREDVEKLMRAVYENDYRTIFSIIRDTFNSSKDIEVFMEEVLSFNRDLLLIKACGTKAQADLFELTEEEFERCAKLADLFAQEKLLYYIHVLEGAYIQMSRTKNAKRLLAETALVEMTKPALHTTPSALLARIADLEKGRVKPASELPDELPTIEKGSLKIESKETPAAQPAEQSVEKAVPYWRDLVEKYGGADMGTATFLGRARAFKRQDGTLCVYVNDSFSQMILQKEEVLHKLKVMAAEFDCRCAEYLY